MIGELLRRSKESGDLDLPPQEFDTTVIFDTGYEHPKDNKVMQVGCAQTYLYLEDWKELIPDPNPETPHLIQMLVGSNN